MDFRCLLRGPQRERRTHPLFRDALALGDAGIARAAFATAMSSAFTISACGVLAAAVLAFLVMRDRGTGRARSGTEQDQASAAVGH